MKRFISLMLVIICAVCAMVACDVDIKNDIDVGIEGTTGAATTGEVVTDGEGNTVATTTTTTAVVTDENGSTVATTTGSPSQNTTSGTTAGGTTAATTTSVTTKQTTAYSTYDFTSKDY